MIRDALEALLPDLTDGEWSLLEDDGHVREYDSGAVDLDHLVERVKRLRQAIGESPARERTIEVAEAGKLARRATTRAQALSALLAVQAAQDPSVVDFRRKELRSHLVKPERVGEWVERRKSEPSELLTVDAKRPDQTLKRSRLVLEYAVAPSLYVQHVAVALHSSLDWLRRVSESLASRFAWWPAQGSLFVLTGLVPIIPPIRSTTTRRLPITATSRITLEIDPTLTPREVAGYYATARKGLLGRRSRRMSEKHLRLAIYAATHKDGTWAERMLGWNIENPDRPYTHSTNFQRDAASALRRLLNPL